MSQPPTSSPPATRSPMGGEQAKPVQPVVWAGNMPLWRGSPPRPRPVWPLIVLLAGMSIALLVFVPAGDYYRYQCALPSRQQGFGMYSADLSLANNVHGSGMLVYYLLLIAQFVVLQIWIWQVTRDAYLLSGGRFAPSPGTAIGLLYIPFFHYVWLWRVLRRLSRFPRPGASSARRGPGFVWTTAYLILAAGAVLAWIVMAMIFERHFFINIFGDPPLEAYVQMAWANGVFVVLNVAGNVALIFAVRTIGRAAAEHTKARMSGAAPAGPLPPVALAQAGPLRPPQTGRVGVLAAMFICFTLSFLLVAGLPLAMALEDVSSDYGPAYFMQSVVGTLLVPGFGLAYVVVLLVWVWRVHDRVQWLTQGDYRPTPGVAMGLLFVPVFQWFYLAWILYRLSRHAARTEASLAGRPPPRSAPGAHYLLAYTLFMGVAFIGAVILAIVYNRARASLGDRPLQVMGACLLAALAIANTVLVIAYVAVGRTVRSYIRTARHHLPPQTAPPMMPVSLPVSVPPENR